MSSAGAVRPSSAAAGGARSASPAGSAGGGDGWGFFGFAAPGAFGADWGFRFGAGSPLSSSGEAPEARSAAGLLGAFFFARSGASPPLPALFMSSSAGGGGPDPMFANSGPNTDAGWFFMCFSRRPQALQTAAKVPSPSDHLAPGARYEEQSTPQMPPQDAREAEPSLERAPATSCE